MARWTPRSAQALVRRSTSGPSTSTLDAHIRSQSASAFEDHDAALDAHAPLGYSDTKHSGRTTRVAPSSAAASSSSMALSMVASASRITGVACTAATRTVSNVATVAGYADRVGP